MLQEGRFGMVDKMFYKNPFLFNKLRIIKFQRTLLMHAVFNEHDDIIRFLLTYDQDFRIVNVDGWNIVHCIVFRLYDDCCVDYLEIVKGNTTNMRYLVYQLDNAGNTPLHVAAQSNNHTAIEWLLCNKANANAKNNSGKLPGQHSKCDNETKKMINRYKGNHYTSSMLNIPSSLV